MPHIRLRILGPFEVQFSDQTTASLSSKKGQALLTFLALHLGQPQTRDRLAGLLWGETKEEFARRIFGKLWRYCVKP